MAKTVDAGVLSGATLFAGMPDETISHIVSKSQERVIAPGQTLFHQGDAATDVYVVLDGLVKLSSTSRAGTEIVVEIFSKGQSFAEALVFSERDYPVTATAILQARVLAVPCHLVRTTLNASPELVNAILASTYQHLHRLILQIERLKGDSSLKRTARFLLAVAEEGQAHPKLPFNKITIAALIGIKPETLSRNFKRLEGYGVHLDGDRLRIEDAAALRDLVFEE